MEFTQVANVIGRHYNTVRNNSDKLVWVCGQFSIYFSVKDLTKSKRGGKRDNYF